MISNTLNGILITFDSASLATLPVHVFSHCLAYRAHCWFPCYQSSVQGCWLGNDWKKKKEPWQAWANNHSMIKAAVWKRTRRMMKREGREGWLHWNITDTLFLSAEHGVETDRGQTQFINHKYCTKMRKQVCNLNTYFYFKQVNKSSCFIMK